MRTRFVQHAVYFNHKPSSPICATTTHFSPSLFWVNHRITLGHTLSRKFSNVEQRSGWAQAILFLGMLLQLIWFLSHIFRHMLSRLALQRSLPASHLARRTWVRQRQIWQIMSADLKKFMQIFDFSFEWQRVETTTYQT